MIILNPDHETAKYELMYHGDDILPINLTGKSGNVEAFLERPSVQRLGIKGNLVQGRFIAVPKYLELP